MRQDRPLTRSECTALLAGGSTGRVGLSIDALPTIVALPYVYEDGGIVVSVEANSKLETALDRNVVCFEVDGADQGTGERWSVVVVGRAASRSPAARPPVDDHERQLYIPVDRVSGWRRAPAGCDGPEVGALHR
jgi:nitroimidazol reductase NimA-like FMN-containing flavoprotein (pyridoxamine 5'-phosphate oxidase superfamily)